MIKSYNGKANGKFILLGEHFVVPSESVDAEGLSSGVQAWTLRASSINESGQTLRNEDSVPALAFPLKDLWCEVSVTPSAHPLYRASLPNKFDTESAEVIESFMARSVYAAANSLRIDVARQPLSVTSKANFSVSRGFGSSAAFAVALVRALDEYRRKVFELAADWDEIWKATSAIERIFHGRPSGVDASVILAGRPIRFENGKVIREIADKSVDFVLIDSGVRENSAQLIQKISTFRTQNSAQWKIFAQTIRALVEACEEALQKKNAGEVGRIINESQGVLSELGLSSPMIDEIISTARANGALGAKVSGAGGGGAVVLVAARGEGMGLAKTMTSRGFSVVATDLQGDSI